MSSAFAPLLAFVLLYFFIAVIAKAAKKSSSAQKKIPGTPAAPAAAPESPAPQPAAAPQVRELQPTVYVTGHDDSVYRGSMNAITGEGYDPCHNEQLAPLTQLETIEHVQTTTPGLQLNWTGDEIVRGLVISEILKRKSA
jgi:hypothetical protein